VTESVAVLLDDEAERVAVAVEIDAHEPLRRARRRPLLPQPSSTRPIHTSPGVEGAGEALGAGVRQPQRLAARRLDDGRDQAVGPVAAEAREDRPSQREASGVQRHPDLRVDADRVKRAHVVLGRHPPRDGEPGVPRQGLEPLRFVKTRAGHAPLPLHEGDQKGGDEGQQLAHALGDGRAGPRRPAVDDHLVVDRVQRRHHAIARQLRQQLRPCGGPEDDLLGTGIEPGPRLLDRADPPTDDTPVPLDQRHDDRAVVAGAQGRVEVDDRDRPGRAKAAGPPLGVAGVNGALPAADELDRLAALEIDARDDHGRTWTPASAS
jgi:hypothetical protein